MSEIGFSCTRCGYCCRTLFVEQSGVINGLCLTEDEITLFDPKLVSPYMALGVEEPTNIIMYQLNQAVCPYINKKNECNVYDRRPLVCQSYPVQVTVMGSFVENDCPQSKYIQNNEFLTTEAGLKTNLYVMNKFAKYRTKQSKMWFFNLATKKWVIAKKPIKKLSKKPAYKSGLYGNK
jgi:Fe-S-cluster containining protein